MKKLMDFNGREIKSPKQFKWRVEKQRDLLFRLFNVTGVLGMLYHFGYDCKIPNEKIKVLLFCTDILSLEYYGTTVSDWEYYTTVDGEVGGIRVADFKIAEQYPNYALLHVAIPMKGVDVKSVCENIDLMFMSSCVIDYAYEVKKKYLELRIQIDVKKVQEMIPLPCSFSEEHKEAHRGY